MEEALEAVAAEGLVVVDVEAEDFKIMDLQKLYCNNPLISLFYYIFGKNVHLFIILVVS